MMAMILNELVLILCLVLLFMTKAALLNALKRGDQRQARVLLILRLGLALSAMTYLLRFLAPASELARFAGFLCTFAGSLLIWIGGMEYWNLLRGRLREPLHSQDEETDDGIVSEAFSPEGAGLPCLNSRTQRVLRHARDEAWKRRQCCVDTDHVLLGLLREPRSAGGAILRRLNVAPNSLSLALGQGAGPDDPPGQPPAADPMPLTARARQAFSLAAQEAHRFEKNSVGTDHLLLGLVLMGTGAAAAALFQEGATVEGIRNEVLKYRARGLR